MIDRFINFITSILNRQKEDETHRILSNLVEEIKLNTSPAGIAKIKKFEGFRAKAYQCSAGVWTIGYGSTKHENGEEVKSGDSISKDDATRLFEHKLQSIYEPIVHKLVKVELNQNQFDALVSFVYNIGESQLKKSTLLKKLNQQDYEGASEEFEKWVYAGGQKLPGLINRREQEKTLFLS